MDAAGDSNAIGAAALTAALGSSSRAIRLAPAKSLADRYCTKPGSFPDGLRTAAVAAPPDDAAPDEVFVREIVRRIAGEKPHELTAPAGSACMYASLLTSQELASVHCEAPRTWDSRRSSPVTPAQLSIGAFLPPGLRDPRRPHSGCQESLLGPA